MAEAGEAAEAAEAAEVALVVSSAGGGEVEPWLFPPPEAVVEPPSHRQKVGADDVAAEAVLVATDDEAPKLPVFCRGVIPVSDDEGSDGGGSWSSVDALHASRCSVPQGGVLRNEFNSRLRSPPLVANQ